MATENLLSTSLTNAAATPLVFTNAAISRGAMREGVGTISSPLAAADVGSTYRFVRVPSNCRISQVLLTNAAFTSGAVNVGVYKAAGGAVVSASFFGSAVSLGSARDHYDVTHQSGTYTVALEEKALWDALGLSADPNIDYEIAYTVSTIFSVAVAMSMKVRYTV